LSATSFPGATHPSAIGDCGTSTTTSAFFSSGTSLYTVFFAASVK
jgi:hypothetical protein